jgi:hypothetical protein
VTDLDDLRDRQLGKRYYDTELEKSFTVVGFTPPGLALLQYDDGDSLDEFASSFPKHEEAARKFDLNVDGLDAEEYVPLGGGPRIQQICDVDEHNWFPWPDEIWPGGHSEEARKATQGHPRDFYNRVVRCTRCGLSGDVAGHFGEYGADGHHLAPWFCHECREAHPGHELLLREDRWFCPDCAPEYSD